MFSCFIKRNHVSIYNWIQKYELLKISSKIKKFDKFVIDETLIKAGSEYIWLWVAIESESKRIVGFSISKERNMLLIAERVISKLVKNYGPPHPVSTADGGAT